MNKTNLLQRLLPAIAGLMLAPTAFAQETQGAQPSVLTETYESWTVQCVNTTEGETTKRSCQMSQELLQQETRQRVVLFAVADAEKGAKGTLVLPFGLRLSEGVRIELADAELARGAFTTCLPAGCLAELELQDASIKQLRGAEKITVVMVASNGQTARTELSLKGFSAAYDRLQALTAG